MPRLTDATKAARRAQIIEAAISCFLEKGYTNTSMSDIIKASGLSSGSIYSHFSGKEDILITAINERLNNVKELYETLPEGAGPQDILETIHTNQLVNDNFSAMLRIRAKSLHAPEIARATADTMPLLQGIIVKTLTPWAAEQLSVLHEINPDPAQRTPDRRRSLPTTPRHRRRLHDGLPGVHAPLLLRHPQGKGPPLPRRLSTSS